MSIPFFRTSLVRSTQLLNASLRNVSRTIGTVNGNSLARVPLSAVLPSFVRSRDLTTTFTVKEPAAKSVSTTKKATPTTRGTVPKTKVAAKKKVASKKKPAAKKKPIKAKSKKVVKPKISKKDWTPPFKKPLTPWTKFVTESFKARAGEQPIFLKDFFREAAPVWKNMSEEQKATYAPTASEIDDYHRKLAQWDADLPKDMRLARRKYRSARRQTPAPPGPLAQFVKEQFHQIQYPSDVTKSEHKIRYLAQVFTTDVSEAEKVDLKQRAREEFSKKQAASA